MSFLTNLYQKTLAENEKFIQFWEAYLTNLKSLDFNTYAEKLRVPIMVPIGNRILFKGELKHTNEVTVALGADYFVKCSVKQAEVLRQHRIKDAESKLANFRNEREYIENQVLFKNENILEKEGQEIIELHTEEEDTAWRKKHRENVRQWKQKNTREDAKEDVITDEELWNRLEELELQEELENELMKGGSEYEKDVKESFVVNEQTTCEQDSNYKEVSDKIEKEPNVNKTVDKTQKKVTFSETKAPKVKEKFELLQKVMDKQNELEEKLLELRNKERPNSKTEQDLIDKLDEMEKLEELEDEMERLEDIIDTEDVTSEEELEEDDAKDIQQSQLTNLKRKVSFADEDNSETLELTFHHSNVEPCKEPYDPKKGITKPSDMYEAFSNLFTETTSILKKTKYEDKDSNVHLPEVEKKVQLNNNVKLLEEKDNEIESKTIVVKDIVEKADVSKNKLNSDSAEKRPMSLFKQRRQQRKS